MLNHGSTGLPSRDCDYAKENLSWNGNSWVCKQIKVDTQCQAAAPDEYRYKDSNGNYVCSKSSQGQDLKYYWTFRGYSSLCSNSSVGYNKLYDCNYKNKNGQVIQVNDSNCKSSKPSVGKKTCITSWTVAGWGGCSKTCGGGTQSRSVTCKTGYSCTGAKPTTSKSCNTQQCCHFTTVTVWVTDTRFRSVRGPDFCTAYSCMPTYRMESYTIQIPKTETRQVCN